jgi:3-hydroxybutyryl-CoA dehydratase
MTTWRPGDLVGRLERTMTAERIRWHVEGLDTAVAGGTAPATAGVNIHTDDDYARAHGLVGAIADGMVTTNWLSGLLVTAFGDALSHGGTLRTKFIRPIFVGDRIQAQVRVTAVDEDGPDGCTIHTELSCENQAGELCTIGTATVWLGSEG